MREILFRGKRKIDNRWIEGNFITDEQDLSKAYIGYLFSVDNDGTVHDTDVTEVDPETVCQYTGLTDKNGRKIFEGDIILHEMAGKIKVQFEKSEFMVIGIDRTMFRAWLSSIHGNFKIIGNIFDNPELIGE